MRNIFIYFGIAIVSISIIVLIKKVLPSDYNQPHSDQVVDYNQSEKNKIGGPFTLIDHNGRSVTEADFQGQYLLVFFGYTFCPDVCPTALSTISSALEELGEDAKKISPLFISIDPKRDTPNILKDFVGNFDPRITALTGTDERILTVTKAYKAYFSRVKEEGEKADNKFYLMNHSAYIYLMGPDGHLLTLFGHERSPQEMASKIKEFL